MSLFSQVVTELQGLYPDLVLDPSEKFATHSITNTENLVLYDEKDCGEWEISEKNSEKVTTVQNIKGATKLLALEFIGAFKDFKKEAEQKAPIDNLKEGGFEFQADTEEEAPETVEAEVLSDADKLAMLDEIMDGKIEVPKPAAKSLNTSVSKRTSNQSTGSISIPENVRSKQITELTTEDIKNYINPLATFQEAEMFLRLCQARGLNPFLKEAYLIKYSSNEPAQFVTGKDAFTRKAEVNPHVKGWKAGIIVRVAATEKSPAGAIEERQGSFKLPEEELLGGWAEIHRDDSMFPFICKVSLEEYIGKKKDGTTSKMWREKPCTMIRKDALVGGLREAVTSELGGMYDAAEMGGEVLEAVYQEVD